MFILSSGKQSAITWLILASAAFTIHSSLKTFTRNDGNILNSCQRRFMMRCVIGHDGQCDLFTMICEPFFCFIPRYHNMYLLWKLINKSILFFAYSLFILVHCLLFIIYCLYTHSCILINFTIYPIGYVFKDKYMCTTN